MILMGQKVLPEKWTIAVNFSYTPIFYDLYFNIHFYSVIFNMFFNMSLIPLKIFFKRKSVILIKSTDFLKC